MNEPRLKDELYNELRGPLLSPTPFKEEARFEQTIGRRAKRDVFLVVRQLITSFNKSDGNESYDDNPVTQRRIINVTCSYNCEL